MEERNSAAEIMFAMIAVEVKEQTRVQPKMKLIEFEQLHEASSMELPNYRK